MERRYIGVKELAEYLGLRVGTLYVWVCQRKIPYIKMGRLVKFDLLEVNKWVGRKQIKDYRDII